MPNGQEAQPIPKGCILGRLGEKPLPKGASPVRRTGGSDAKLEKAQNDVLRQSGRLSNQQTHLLCRTARRARFVSRSIQNRR